MIQRISCAIPEPPFIARLCTLLRQQPAAAVIALQHLAERIVVAIFTDRVVIVVGEHDSKSERGISKTQRRVTVGYRPKGGDRDTPQISIKGKRLAEAGFAVGTGVSLTVLDGCLLLLPDSPEERRLRAMEQQLRAQQLELDQSRQRIKAVLA
ncbi:SymE family type I addiction module toxin [Pseudomonas cerasi]